MPDHQRPGDAFEAALSRGLRRGHQPGDACLAADQLAAYWDQTLDPDERTHAEAHLAGCSRCQAALAGLTRAAEATAEPVVRAARLGWVLDWRWLAPAATVAVAIVAVWVIEPGAPTREAQTPDSPAPTASRDELQNEAREQAAAVLDQATTPAEQVARRDNLSVADAELLELDEPEPTAPARLEGERARLEAPATAAADADEPSPPDAFATRALQSREAVAASADLVVTSPDPLVRWRIHPDGAVTRSTDGGQTWAIQRPAGGSALTAGSAPSNAVCWVVGRGGAIARTVDGVTWATVGAPTSTDLVGVTALDADMVEITAADGTRYRTSDGGATWIQF